MLDMGFRDDLEFILEAAPAERRSLLFSATIPREITGLAKRYQRDALRIAVGAQNKQHADIEYRAVRIAPNEIERAVVNVLRFFEARGALVFCGTRENVRHLHGNLLERGFEAVALSGELSQAERNRAMQALRDGRARVCIATDVAARGIDLPDLELVIHADLPQSHETLLHRSGRTGRAGRKGTSVLVVPYTRARKAERLLYAAHVEALWTSAPSVEQIKARDQERLTREVASSVEGEVAEEDRAAAQTLLAERSAEEIAAALVRLHRARLPAPEELYDGGPAERDRGPASAGRDRPREDRPRERDRDRSPRADVYAGGRSGGGGGSAATGAPEVEGGAPAAERAPPVRADAPAVSGAPAVWFRLNVGRSNNADPRWLIPLICRRGHVTKQDIGEIRILDRETRFEIAGYAAEKFADAAGRADDRDEGVRIEAARPERGAGGGAAGAGAPPRDRREVIRLPRRGGAPDRAPAGGAPPRRGPRVGRAERGTA
jgi:ATP-dependent RNA helicase DeaD